MKTLRFDSYVVETLMPDLVGHDQKPSAFMVYLYLWSRLASARTKKIQASHQTIADDTGLSKSAVQMSVRHLVRRRLIRSELASRTATPVYSLMRPWRRSVPSRRT
ncbi:MAG TPA: helix-turn-helix domain-containing protein [Terriglobia bacterium]|nr:helix-turn-helix domain-containing protein [Terriglobia bacterium]